MKPLMDLIHVPMIIDFYGTIPNPVYDLKGKVTDLEYFLQFQIFAKPSMDLIHVLHDDRVLSKILQSTILIPEHGLKVKVTGFEFLC